MRSFLNILMGGLICLAPIGATAHGYYGHLVDATAVLHDYATSCPEAFTELFDATSYAMDISPKDLYEFAMRNGYKNLKGFNQKTHRRVLHWSFDAPIPEEFLTALEEENGIPREVILNWCKKQNTIITAKAMRLTGLPKAQAQAFAALIGDIHILGDLIGVENSTMQSLLDYNTLLTPEKVVDSLCRHLKTLRVEDVNKIRKQLMKVVKKHGAMKDVSQIKTCASELMDEIKNLKLGDKTYAQYEKTLRETAQRIQKLNRLRSYLAKSKLGCLSSSVANVYDKSLEGMAKAMLEHAEKCGKIYTPEKLKALGVTEVKKVVGTLQEVTLQDGTKKLVLSVPIETMKTGLKTGVATGVMTLLFDEMRTVYGFSQGKMTEADFQRETIGNCGKALIEGTAVFVAVILGASPHGWVVIGVGLGTYILCDIVYKGICQWIDGPGFELEDIIGELPTEIQRRQTAFSYEGYETLLKYQGRVSAFDTPSGESAFDAPSAESPFDYSGHDSAFDAFLE